MDDLVVYSPSSTGLQQFLHICSTFGVEHDIRYNDRKSAPMTWRTKDCKHLEFQKLKLLENILIISNKVKYFGHLITDKIMDNEDIYTQCQMLHKQTSPYVNLMYVQKE